MESYPFLMYYVSNVCYVRDCFLEIDGVIGGGLEGGWKVVGRLVERVVGFLMFFNDVLDNCSGNLEGVIVDALLQFLVWPSFIGVFAGGYKKEFLGVKTAVFGFYLTLSLVRQEKLYELVGQALFGGLIRKYIPMTLDYAPEDPKSYSYVWDGRPMYDIQDPKMQDQLTEVYKQIEIMNKENELSKKIPQEVPTDTLLEQSKNFEQETDSKTRRNTINYGKGRSQFEEIPKPESDQIGDSYRELTTASFGVHLHSRGFFETFFETGTGIMNKFNYSESSKFMSEFHSGNNTFEKYIKCLIEKDDSILTMAISQPNQQ